MNEQLSTHGTGRTMDTMIAARLHAYGAPMTLDRIPVPQPRPNDVLVEVHACGIVPNLARVVSNFFGTQTPDLKMIAAAAGDFRPRSYRDHQDSWRPGECGPTGRARLR